MEYNRPLTEDELRQKLERYIDAAETHVDSEIAYERVRGYDAYFGKPFGNEKPNRSQHISRDVFDAVESVKSVLLQTFNASESVVRFEPRDEDDVPMADQATRYVNHVFYKQNNGYRLLHDLIHDGLVAKMGIAKVYWEPNEESEYESLTGPIEMLDMALSQPNIELAGEIQDNGDGTVTAELVQIKDASQVRVEIVAPERFFVDPDADDIETSRFTADISYVTQAELLDLGFDHEQIEKLSPDKSSYNEWEETSRERISPIVNDDQEYYRLFECYLRCDLDGTGEEALYQIAYCDDKVLSVQQVDKHPYYTFCPFPLPHQVYGLSLADQLFDIQKSRSTLQRLIIDNQAMANTSRVVANLSMVKNPRELVDNNIGGVINAADPTAVVPMPTPSLSPAAFQTDELFAREKEQRSGVSRISNGIDPQALNGNNSGKLIEALGTMGNRKIMTMARHLAELFLRPLLNEVYRLALQYEEKPQTIRVGGKFMQVIPKQLGDRADMTVRVALTPDESRDQAQAMVALHQMIMQDPLYGDKQRHALLAETAARMGIAQTSAYLMSPEDPEYQQMQQMAQQQQAQAQQAQAQMAQMQMQLQQQALQIQQMKVQNDFLLGQANIQLKSQDSETKYDLQEEKQSHDAAMDLAELQLETQQNRNVTI
mgnify:CR=1 FL=1